jgi:hypothetical protein
MGSAMNLKEWLPALFMVLVQIFMSGHVLLTKVVVDGGSFAWTLLTYRFFLAAILTAPLAMFFEKLALTIIICYLDFLLFVVTRNILQYVEGS